MTSPENERQAGAGRQLRTPRGTKPDDVKDPQAALRKAIARTVTKYRRKAKLTQMDVSVAFGSRYSTFWSRYECAQLPFTAEQLDKFAGLVGVTAAQILEEAKGGL